MTKSITLDYRPTEVVIRADENLSRVDWDRVANDLTCGKALLLRNDRILSAPWDLFLAYRFGLGSLLSVHTDIQVNATPEFTQRLEQADRDLQALRADDGERKASPEFVIDKLQEAGFKRSLRPYQLSNVQRLISLPHGATFTVPGGGKTTEALALWACTRTSQHRLLVVAPKNAFMAWEDETQTCLPNQSVVRLIGGADSITAALAEDPLIAIITYQQLIRVWKDILVPHLHTRPYQLYIDESHRMKGGEAIQTGEAVLALGIAAQARRLIMTGTPMPQGYGDLVPQFRFLFPSLLPIDTEQAEDYVRKEFWRYYVRTTKQRLMLPERTCEVIRVPLRPAQRRLYNIITKHTVRLAAGLDIHDRTAFRAIARSVMRLIQACTNPALLAGSQIADQAIYEDALGEGIPIKVEFCEQLVRTLVKEGHKVVVWSIFVREIEELTERLQDLGAACIHGQVKSSADVDDDSSRESIIRRFNDPTSSAKVLVANPAACSEAISLHHVCHRAVYLDRSYNAGHWLQSGDRIHRVGLRPDQDTKLYVIVAQDTIDDLIEQRLLDKVMRMEEVLDDPSLRPTTNIYDVDEADLPEDQPAGLTTDDVTALLQHLKVRVA